MKKMLLILAMIFALPQALATAISIDGLKINVTPMDGGAWVKLTQDGIPIEGAIVNDKYTTTNTGRVFVPIRSEPATSAKFVAITPDNKSISAHAFIPRQ